MGYTSGTLSNEQMEYYGMSEIPLLNYSNGDVSSGIGGTQGSGSYTWSVTWSQSGFTSISWSVFSWEDLADDLEAAYAADSLEEWFHDPNNLNEAMGILQVCSWYGGFRNCVTWEEVTT